MKARTGAGHELEPGKRAFGMATGVGLGAVIDNLPIGIVIGIASGAAASGFYPL